MKTLPSMVFFVIMISAVAASGGGKPVDCSLFRFVEVGMGDEPDAKVYRVKGGGEEMPVTGPDIVNACSVESAEVVLDKEFGWWNVRIEFTEEGSRAFAKATERLKGRKIAVIYNGEILMAPVVRDTIANGTAILTGNFLEREAREMARVLNKGRGGWLFF